MKKIKLNDIVKVNQSGEWGTGLKEGEIGTKVIRTADFNNDGSINYDNVIFRNIQQKKIDEKKLIYGDIIIEKSGGTDKNPVGRVVFFNDDNNIYLSNNFTQVIRIKESMNSKFVFYNLYFNYKNGSTLQMFNKTTGIQNLQMKQFLNQKISYISLEEQEIAVRKLDNVRNIIEIKQKQLQDLDELIKSQFVEMFGSLELNDKNFEEQELSSIAEISSSKRIYANEYKKNGIPFYRSKEIIELGHNKKPSIELFISDKRYEEIKDKYGIPKKGDILITAVGTIGEIWIVDTDEPFYYKDGNVLQIRLKTDIAQIYFKYVLDILISIFKNKNVSGSAYSALTIEKFKKMKIILPPIELQNQFADIVKQIDKQKFEIQKSLEEMQKLQESLMNKYFGEY